MKVSCSPYQVSDAHACMCTCHIQSELQPADEPQPTREPYTHLKGVPRTDSARTQTCTSCSMPAPCLGQANTVRGAIANPIR